MIQHSVKDRLRYRDISWLMPNVDVETVLDKLSVDHSSRKGYEIRGFCPDHHLFTGKRPSDPNWTVNVDTGQTYCFTEPRGSNLVWVVCRLLECSADESARFLAGAKGNAPTDLLLAGLRNRIGKMRTQREVAAKEEPAVRGMDDIWTDLERRPVSDRFYRFFMTPPGKKPPTNILPATVDRFEAFERSWGYYLDRAVIPYRFKGQLVGFVAIDLLGEQEWRKKHPVDDDYRKTLYPLGFSSATCLGGYDDCVVGERLILVEDKRSKMKLWQEGFPNCVSLNGARLHGGQLQLISMLAPKEVCVMMDGDAAGRRATDEVAETLRRHFPVRRCYVPVGMDPKNLDRGGIEVVLEKSELVGNCRKPA
jgi:5S rRNA maturation endonuclease (ribonuclease M5)